MSAEFSGLKKKAAVAREKIKDVFGKLVKIDARLKAQDERIKALEDAAKKKDV